jgi:uncharacterized protein YukE
MSKDYNLPVSGGVDGTNIIVPMTLEDAGAYIEGQASIIVGELETLKAKLTAFEPTWTGTAAGDWNILQQEWNIGAQGLFGGNGEPGVLGDIAHAMHVNWSNYSDAEWANSQTWRSK